MNELRTVPKGELSQVNGGAWGCHPPDGPPGPEPPVPVPPFPPPVPPDPDPTAFVYRRR